MGTNWDVVASRLGVSQSVFQVLVSKQRKRRGTSSAPVYRDECSNNYVFDNGHSSDTRAVPVFFGVAHKQFGTEHMQDKLLRVSCLHPL